MPFYKSEGKVPKKRHTTMFNGKKLYYEELISRNGFSSIYTNVYHLNRPTQITKIGKLEPIILRDSTKKYRARHIKTSNIHSGNLDNRTNLLYNLDLTISVLKLDNSCSFFFKNGIEDELFYVQYGSGSLSTNFGDLSFKPGDYIIIPRGIIFKFIISESIKLLSVQSKDPIETPNKYKNNQGQLLEHSPYCERDIRVPKLNDPIDEKGDFLIKVKTNKGFQTFHYATHPFDLVGWDGYYFPWILSIHDFEPIVGSIHQPPPVHQTFQSKNFVICSFVPRPFDFHPNSIPAPYPHSNLDSDEVIYYSKGDFMSRKGIDTESITLHPMGIPHGPQPGKYQSSVGKKHTDELAVMIDTFKSLNIAYQSSELDDPSYPLSWIN
ncbi:MAG: homogentisate 1,2-dioxygenase [Candidatus Marinimicrobia bacterium]|nr:homogentisate 1,2-dioxygenase [Candidatus Neomarinimicrobiota bacterium]